MGSAIGRGNIMPEIVFVPGATGTTGMEVVRQLVEKGVAIRAGVHSEVNADKVRKLGADPVALDRTDVRGISAALDGVRKAYSLSSFFPNLAELGANFVEAAKTAGVQHVVRGSAIGADTPDPITLGKWHRAAEEALEDSGISYTIIRPNVFMQNYFNLYGETIRGQDAFYLPQGDGRISMVDVRDVAAVIVAALTEDGHEGKAYEVTGPEALSNDEVAEVLSKVTGRSISYVDAPEDAARQGMKDAGFPGSLVEPLLELSGVIKAGFVSAVSQTVAEVAGRPPISFEQFANDHRNQFQ
ncbi:MAG: NAD(P)-dependent oxidoreductase [Chloroflexi bacterium]|nr:NAD(P)-dependent oxidoreductase [Chloroflexota bacterium]